MKKFLLTCLGFAPTNNRANTTDPPRVNDDIGKCASSNLVVSRVGKNWS